MRSTPVISALLLGTLALWVQAHPALQARQDLQEPATGEAVSPESSTSPPAVPPPEADSGISSPEEPASPSPPIPAVPTLEADPAVPSVENPAVSSSPAPSSSPPVGDPAVPSPSSPTISPAEEDPALPSPPASTISPPLEDPAVSSPSAPVTLPQVEGSAVPNPSAPTISQPGRDPAASSLSIPVIPLPVDSEPQNTGVESSSLPSPSPPEGAGESEVTSALSEQSPEQSDILGTTAVSEESASAVLPSNQPSQSSGDGGEEGKDEDKDDDEDDDDSPPAGVIVGGGGKGNPPGIGPPDIDPPDIEPPDIDPPETDPPETDPPETNPPKGDPPKGNPPDDPPSDPEPSDPTTPSPSPTTESENESSTSASTATSSDPCAATELPGGIVRRQSAGDAGACEVIEEYTVIPEDGSDGVKTAAAKARILAMVPPTNIVDTAELDSHGVLYWNVRLTHDQAIDLFQDSNIGAVLSPCHDKCYDPTTEIVMQAGAPDELVTLGQFPEQKLDWYHQNYVYNELGGKDVDVYILDSGANLNHPEFTGGTGIASRARWIHTNPEIEEIEDDGGGGGAAREGHGTCMLSRMGGHMQGVAKSANPVIVRVPRKPISPRGEAWIAGLRRIRDDIGDGKKTAVLSMSLYWPRMWQEDPLSKLKPVFTNPDGSDAYDDVRPIYASLLREIIEKGVTVVTGTGNGSLKEMDGIPATFADPNAADYIRDLIVVGAASPQGDRIWPRSNSDSDKGLPHVYAAGEYLLCPQLPGILGEEGYRRSSGTSLAAAAVSGLAAYFIALGNEDFPEIDVSTPELLKREILKLAYARADNKAINNIYNGVRPADASGRWKGPACRIVARQLNENDLPDFKDCDDPPEGLEEDPKPGDDSGDNEDGESSEEEGGEEEQDEKEDDDKEDDDKEDDDTDNLACDEPGAQWCVDVWGPPGS